MKQANSRDNIQSRAPHAAARAVAQDFNSTEALLFQWRPPHWLNKSGVSQGGHFVAAHEVVQGTVEELINQVVQLLNGVELDR